MKKLASCGVHSRDKSVKDIRRYPVSAGIVQESSIGIIFALIKRNHKYHTFNLFS